MSTWATIAFALAFAWLLPVAIAFPVGIHKNRTSPVWLALLLGWIGLLVTLPLPLKGVKCPRCAETVRLDAEVCRYCGTEL